MAAPQQPQSPDPRKEAARQGGTWTEEEKTRGAAGTADAGAAGEAEPKGGPTGDRAETEAAAAQIQGAPDPDTPVGGGKGTRSTGGSATEPGSDPQAPRNPA
jgi:hypothetical protein